MKKQIIVIFFALFFSFSLVSALNIEINAKPLADVVVPEFANPAVFELTITNNGPEKEIEIFSLAGVDISPREFFTLPEGESEIEIQVTPQESLRERIKGMFSFEYKIRSKEGDFVKGKLTMNLVPLEKILMLSALPINPSDEKATITLNNTKKSQFDNLELELSSIFFNEKKKLSIKPLGDIQFSIPLQKDMMEKTSAGAYIMAANVNYNNASISINGVIDYIARESVSIKSQMKGFLIKKTELTKKNEGNTNVKASLAYNKDIITRLFTTFSITSDSIKRKGFNIQYTWEKNIGPGESLVVTATTNYTLPFLLIVFIIIIAILVRIYYTTTLILAKRVSFVKTKGGEFALKISLHLKARKPVTDIVVEDRLPPMAKLYERFGKMPDAIDPARRTLSWKFSQLAAGEERFFSYIIYSKLKIFGTFNLPAARAAFTSNGTKETIFSNQTSFMAETAIQD